MLRIFLITLSLTSLTRAIVVNKLIDSILESAKLELRKEGKTALPLPDVMKHFEWKLLRGFGYGTVSMDFDFSAEDGTFTDLSSFRRIGYATMISTGHTAKITFSVTFDTFQVIFKKYVAQLDLFLSWVGAIKVSSFKNSVSGIITLDRKGDKCRATVEKTSIDPTLDGFNVQHTSKGDLGPFRDKLLQWLLIEAFNDNVKMVWYNCLKETLKSAPEVADLCSKM